MQEEDGDNRKRNKEIKDNGGGLIYKAKTPSKKRKKKIGRRIFQITIMK